MAVEECRAKQLKMAGGLGRFVAIRAAATILFVEFMVFCRRIRRRGEGEA